MDLATVCLVVGVTFCVAWVMGMLTERWRNGDDEQTG
jgi:hypothetical protein